MRQLIGGRAEAFLGGSFTGVIWSRGAHLIKNSYLSCAVAQNLKQQCGPKHINDIEYIFIPMMLRLTRTYSTALPNDIKYFYTYDGMSNKNVFY